MQVGMVYHAKVDIFPDHAEFWLNGEKYYSCKLQIGNVPNPGKVGFTSYSGKGTSTVFNYKVTNLPYSYTPEPLYV